METQPSLSSKALLCGSSTYWRLLLLKPMAPMSLVGPCRPRVGPLTYEPDWLLVPELLAVVEPAASLNSSTTGNASLLVLVDPVVVVVAVVMMAVVGRLGCLDAILKRGKAALGWARRQLHAAVVHVFLHKRPVRVLGLLKGKQVLVGSLLVATKPRSGIAHGFQHLRVARLALLQLLLRSGSYLLPPLSPLAQQLFPPGIERLVPQVLVHGHGFPGAHRDRSKVKTRPLFIFFFFRQPTACHASQSESQDPALQAGAGRSAAQNRGEPQENPLRARQQVQPNRPEPVQGLASNHHAIFNTLQPET
eukprot:m.231828 g.231828  ORF g.231828 m.231828 type:complete len:306 (+) comp22434_c0_seq2:1324-2241(+)